MHDRLPMGNGTLFADPSAESIRAASISRQRKLIDKRHTVAAAVARLIHDGDYLAIGGFGTNRIPTAILHEIIRTRKQNLAFAGHTATHDFQILCAGNLTGYGQTLSRVDIAYVVGLEARGLSPHARRVMESGTVACTEWTNYALSVRLQAAALGVSFLPMRSMLGTDTFNYSAAQTIVCPFTAQRYVAVPALAPDVAVIHVHEADIHGNATLRGVSVADLELARAAKKVIVTCERLVTADHFRQDPNKVSIPFLCVDAVCEVPFGSYPGNMPGEYFSDEDHLRAWLEAEKNPATFLAFLDQHIHSVPDFHSYLNRCGGIPRLQELRRQEYLLAAPS